MTTTFSAEGYALRQGAAPVRGAARNGAWKTNPALPCQMEESTVDDTAVACLSCTAEAPDLPCLTHASCMHEVHKKWLLRAGCAPTAGRSRGVGSSARLYTLLALLLCLSRFKDGRGETEAGGGTASLICNSVGPSNSGSSLGPANIRPYVQSNLFAP
jgi:hypothetical protein